MNVRLAFLVLAIQVLWTTVLSSEIITTIPTPEAECAKLNSTCDDCVNNTKCMYCFTSSRCVPYPIGKVFPTSDDCPPDMGAARWGTCMMNFKILLISMGVLAGIVVLAIVVCICCCCCRKGGSAKAAARIKKDEEKWSKEESERKERFDARRVEREEMYDQIRQKYGLTKDGSPPYQRM